MKAKDNEQEYCDIDAECLTSLFDTLRHQYPTYYILLQHSTCDLFAIHQMYDYRKKKRASTRFADIIQPLRWLSAQEFMENADMFHKYDEFRVSLLDGLCVLNKQFDADILLTLLRQNITSDCRQAHFLSRLVETKRQLTVLGYQNYLYS